MGARHLRPGRDRRWPGCWGTRPPARTATPSPGADYDAARHPTARRRSTWDPASPSTGSPRSWSSSPGLLEFLEEQRPAPRPTRGGDRDVPRRHGHRRDRGSHRRHRRLRHPAHPRRLTARRAGAAPQRRRAGSSRREQDAEALGGPRDRHVQRLRTAHLLLEDQLGLDDDHRIELQPLDQRGATTVTCRSRPCRVAGRTRCRPRSSTSSARSRHRRRAPPPRRCPVPTTFSSARTRSRQLQSASWSASNCTSKGRSPMWRIDAADRAAARPRLSTLAARSMIGSRAPDSRP